MRKLLFLLTTTLLAILATASSVLAKGVPADSVPASTMPTDILVLTERGGQHESFAAAAIGWLDGFCKDHGFQMTVINNTRPIDSAYLAQFDLFIQLDYPPYTWSDTSKKAFETAIDEGRLGWIGFHHATLLGDFDGWKMWEWFSDFMGGIRFKNYIANTSAGTVHVENSGHPVMKGVNASFMLENDEWYTFDRTPRPNVNVLATVDEESYTPASDIRMGDHPVVWTNELKKAKNVYFLFGHSGILFDSPDFRTMFSNAILWAITQTQARFPRFRALAFYSENVEGDHVTFAHDAKAFFGELNSGEGLQFDFTSDMNDMNDAKLKNYDVILWLNNQAHTQAQRKAFQRYMENGGGWVGFHVAAYNDRGTNWPWFLDFLGGGVFWRNNWPAGPAKLVVENSTHPVTKGLPETFISPHNEWYQWKPSPRERKNIQVLVSLSSENYPLGFKDILPDGDLPVVWTNTNYRMIYLNMGHGGRIFSDATQNYLILNALRWVVSTDRKGNPFEK